VAAGIPCPSVESIGSAILAAPRVIAGTVLGVSAAVALSFVVENFVWFALGAAVLIGAALTVLVRKTHRNLRDGRAVWQPSMATTQHRLNGAQRPAVEAPRRPALEAPKARLPQETARALRELAGAIIPIQAATRAEAAYRRQP
jgi:hypothetical protein